MKIRTVSRGIERRGKGFTHQLPPESRAESVPSRERVEGNRDVSTARTSVSRRCRGVGAHSQDRKVAGSQPSQSALDSWIGSCDVETFWRLRCLRIRAEKRLTEHILEHSILADRDTLGNSLIWLVKPQRPLKGVCFAHLCVGIRSQKLLFARSRIQVHF